MNAQERPEALAQFAESARRGERSGVAGLTATEATAPIPTDPKAKDDAAARILAEGATGQDFSSEEAIERLPDRILESQDKSGGEDAQNLAAAEPIGGDTPYDATRDPRTGRPPTPLEAQRLARENEVERLRQAQTPDQGPEENADEDEFEAGEESGEAVLTEDLDISDLGSAGADGELGAVQRPARMTSPELDEDERAAVDDLVGAGIARERAEELVKEHGTNTEALKAEASETENLPVER